MPELTERVVVRRTLPELRDLFRSPERWLKTFGLIAASLGEGTSGPSRADRTRSHRVVVDLGTWESSRDGIRIPVVWRCSGYQLVFPLFTGHLHLQEAPDGATVITLTGTYRLRRGVASESQRRGGCEDAAAIAVRSLMAYLRTALEEHRSS